MLKLQTFRQTQPLLYYDANLCLSDNFCCLMGKACILCSSLGGARAALPEADDPRLGAEGHVDELLVEQPLGDAHAVGQAQDESVLAHLINVNYVIK